MRAVRRGWRRLELGWRTSLRRLPFFTQRTAVLLVGVLVASLAMLGAWSRSSAGWPGANGPTHLVPASGPASARSPAPGPGTAAPGGPPAAPPTTPAASTTTTTVPPGPLDPVNDLLGPVVSTLLP